VQCLVSKADEKVRQRVAKALKKQAAREDFSAERSGDIKTPMNGPKPEPKIDAPLAVWLGLGLFGYQALDMPSSARVRLACRAICILLVGRIAWLALAPKWPRILGTIRIPVLRSGAAISCTRH
jgi:hypothetical protein